MRRRNKKNYDFSSFKVPILDVPVEVSLVDVCNYDYIVVVNSPSEWPSLASN